MNLVQHKVNKYTDLLAKAINDNKKELYQTKLNKWISQSRAQNGGNIPDALVARITEAKANLISISEEKNNDMTEKLNNANERITMLKKNYNDAKNQAKLISKELVKLSIDVASTKPLNNTYIPTIDDNDIELNNIKTIIDIATMEEEIAAIVKYLDTKDIENIINRAIKFEEAVHAFLPPLYKLVKTSELENAQLESDILDVPVLTEASSIYDIINYYAFEHKNTLQQIYGKFTINPRLDTTLENIRAKKARKNARLIINYKIYTDLYLPLKDLLSKNNKFLGDRTIDMGSITNANQVKPSIIKILTAAQKIMGTNDKQNSNSVIIEGQTIVILYDNLRDDISTMDIPNPQILI